ncbi:hypothetical protein ACFQ51_04130 [Streptomyces kaempferi]
MDPAHVGWLLKAVDRGRCGPVCWSAATAWPTSSTCSDTGNRPWTCWTV